MTRTIIFCVVSLLLGVGITVGGYYAFNGSDKPPENGSDANEDVNANSNCHHRVNALGYLLPRDGIISVSGTPGDQLAMINVKPGELVSKEHLLAEMKSRQMRFLEWKARETQRTEATAQIQAELDAANKKIAAAKLAQKKIDLQKIEESAQLAQIEFLETNLRLVNRTMERLEGVPQSLVSVQKREQQELLVEKSRAELNAAKRTLERLQASRDYAQEVAQAELEVAQAALTQIRAADKSQSLEYAENLASLQHQQTRIKAPSDGTVLKTFMSPGESISAQPILQMADLTKMTCHAEVFETDIQCVSLGQKVRVTSPAFSGTSPEQGIPGTVKRISQLVSAPKLQSLDPYAAADRHVVAVEIEFDESASLIAGKFVNLQVQVQFLAK